MCGKDDHPPYADVVRERKPYLIPGGALNPDYIPCWCDEYSRDVDGVLPERNLEHELGVKGCISEPIDPLANEPRTILPGIARTWVPEPVTWCAEPDCLAKPHRLVIESHSFSTYPPVRSPWVERALHGELPAPTLAPVERPGVMPRTEPPDRA